MCRDQKYLLFQLRAAGFGLTQKEVGRGAPKRFEQKRDEITAEQGRGQWGDSVEVGRCVGRP